MALVNFISSNKISQEFLAKVIGQLEADEKRVESSVDREILSKVISDLKVATPDSHKRSLARVFVLNENEYNFLNQNDASLWAPYLIFRYQFKIYPVIKKLTNFPIHLLIEPVSYCNLRCTMCFQIDKTFTQQKSNMGVIDFELYKKVIDEAVEQGCKALTLASRGEPTLHPQFELLLEYACGKFFDLKLNTNATRLTEARCHSILKNGVTELVFSVDSEHKEDYENIRRGGKFEEVVKNIQMFHAIRAAHYPQSKCKTRISAVRCAPNFNPDSFVDFWGKIVDYVVCVPVQNRWDAYNNAPTKNTSACSVLWERMYVWFDGVVNPCDYDYKSMLSVGNAKNNSLQEIWMGEAYTRLRENHLKGERRCHVPCDRCEL